MAESFLNGPITSLFLDGLPMGTVLLRLEPLGDSPNLRLLYANPAQADILGLPLDAFVGKLLTEAFPNAAATGILDSFLTALRTGERSQAIPLDYGDDRIAHNRFILWAIPLTGDLLLVLTENPTARLQETAELRRLESRFRSLIANAPDGMVIVGAQGIIQLVNAQTEKLFGYERDELLGKHVEVLIPDELASLHRSHRAGYTRDPHTRLMGQGLELLGKRKDGTYFPVEIALAPLETEGGMLVSASIRDITERKKTEEALRQSEERLRAILDNAYDAFVAMDEQGRITGWNTAAGSMFGWSRDEAMGRMLADTIIPPAQQDAHRKGLANFLRTGVGPVLDRRLELTAERRDGSLFPVEVSIRAQEYGGARSFNAFIADITERKQAERELAELNRTLEQRVEERSNELLKSEARYHDALDSMMEGVQIIDFDWRYVYVNNAVVAQSTYAREELIGRTMMEKYPGIEHTGLFRVLRRCMTERTAEVMQNQFAFPDGSIGHFELSIQPMTDGLFILSTDITERKRAQEALRTSEERFRAIIEQFPLAVVTYSPDGTATNANRAWEVMWEEERGNIVGYNIRKDPHLLSSGLARHVEAAFAGELSEVEPYLHHPAPGGHKDGKRWIKMVLFPMKDANGRVSEVVQVSEDVTQRKETEMEIRKQSERLERQNRELEQFTYIASHDLQEPLRMISSYVQLLQRRYTDRLDKDANEFIDFAVDGAQRLKQLINDLLVYSRLDKPMETTDVDMGLVLEDALRNLASAVTESAAYITHGDLPVVRGSHTQMVQLLQNLLSNAIKFRKEHATPRIHVDVVAEEGTWTFSVSDNGIGMDEQYAENVFMPFKRLSNAPQYTGTGIGLAIAKKTVERYGGRIWFRSKPGEGTTFHFTLPQNHA